MKIDAYHRRIIRQLALEALAVNPVWATHVDVGQTDFVDWPDACARFAAAMSPQRVLDMLEDLEVLSDVPGQWTKPIEFDKLEPRQRAIYVRAWRDGQRTERRMAIAFIEQRALELDSKRSDLDSPSPNLELIVASILDVRGWLQRNEHEVQP